MQKPKAIRLAIMSGFVGAVTLVLFAVLTFAIPTAQATPAIAKESRVAPVMQVRHRAKLI